jgi:hypothetical protein
MPLRLGGIAAYGAAHQTIFRDLLQEISGLAMEIVSIERLVHDREIMIERKAEHHEKRGIPSQNSTIGPPLFYSADRGRRFIGRTAKRGGYAEITPCLQG